MATETEKKEETEITSPGVEEVAEEGVAEDVGETEERRSSTTTPLDNRIGNQTFSSSTRTTLPSITL
jgi:hypothetical protein